MVRPRVLAILRCRTGSVAHQAAGRRELAQRVNRRQRVARRQRDELTWPGDEERIDVNAERADSILNERGEGCLKIAVGAGLNYKQFSPKRIRCCLHVSRVGRRIGIDRMDEEADRSCLGNRLVQYLELFGQQTVGQKTHTGNVPARSIEAGNKCNLDGIGANHEDDRNGCARCLRSTCHRSGTCKDHSRFALDQIGYQRRQPTVIALRPAVFDRHALSLDKAGLGQSLLERRDVGVKSLLIPAVQKPNDRQRRLLRACREWPCHRTANKRSELPPVHSMPLCRWRRRGQNLGDRRSHCINMLKANAASQPARGTDGENGSKREGFLPGTCCPKNLNQLTFPEHELSRTDFRGRPGPCRPGTAPYRAALAARPSPAGLGPQVSAHSGYGRSAAASDLLNIPVVGIVCSPAFSHRDSKGIKLEVIDLIRLPPLFVISLVRPRRKLSLAPTGRMLTPSRTQGVSRLAALAATVRLGLDTTEHDGHTGSIVASLFPFFGLLQYWTLPAVFAVEAPKASETMVRRRLRPLLCPERDQQMTRGSPRPRPPPNRRCLAAKGRGAVN